MGGYNPPGSGWLTYGISPPSAALLTGMETSGNVVPGCQDRAVSAQQPVNPLDFYTDFLDRERWLDVAMCWTVIEPVGGALTVDEVARRLGGDPAQIRRRSWEESDDGAHRPMIYLLQVGRAVVMIEYNGFQGSLPEVLGRLSRGARVHSSYWNVNMNNSLSCAALGSILVSVDGQFPDDRHGIDIDAFGDDIDLVYAAAHDEAASFYPAMMAVVEMRTGVRFDPAWLEDDQPAIVLDYTAGAADPPVVGIGFDPELETAMRLASPAQAQAATDDLVEILLATGFLDGEPEVDAVRAARDAGAPPGDGRYTVIGLLAERFTGRWENADFPTGPLRADPVWRAMHAAQAVQSALVPHPIAADVAYPLQSARYALGDAWPATRSRLCARLRRPAVPGA